MGFFSAVSILWESGGRRDEAVYSVLIRSLNAFYLLLKRRRLVYIPKYNVVFFMLLYALISYIYFHQGECLKYKSMWDTIWGEEDQY